MIISYYEKLGIASSFTCVPFQSFKVPRRGTSVAWAESSAAVYANSILGLKTNRESAVSALASALTGKTVYSDLHIPRNRKPSKNIRIKMENRARCGQKGSFWFGRLWSAGLLCREARAGRDRIPGTEWDLQMAEAKALCAAIGTTGSSGMFVPNSKEGVETIEFTEKEYEDTFSDLSQSGEGEVIIFGCPQMTIEELYELSRMLNGKNLRKKCYVFCSSKIYEIARTRGYSAIIEAAGGTFVRDACADFTPLISALDVDAVETDSCKGAHYMRKVHGVKIALKDTKRIIEENSA